MTILVIAVAAFAAVRFLMSPAPLPSGGVELVTRFTKPHFVKYRPGGEREWSLRADVVEEASDGSGTVAFQNISEGILFRDGEPHFRFVADQGSLTSERDLRLVGNVVFYEGDEPVFASQEVIWRSSEEIVLAPGTVTAHYDGHTLLAGRLEARLKEDTVELSGNVMWTTGDGIEVTADRAVYADERLEFSGLTGPVRVRLERESST